MRSNHRDNLLIKLFSYTPREGRLALEDFCTEALAWCLRNCSTFRVNFLKALDPSIESKLTVGVETQVRYESDEGDNADDGRLDLVLRTDDNDLLAIVEVKIASDFRADQLSRYRKELERQEKFKRRILATLTDKQANQDDTDVHIKWSQVCRLLESQACTPTAPDMAATVCIQFAEFLKGRGLGPIDLPRIAKEPLNHWVVGVRYSKRLEDILNSVKNDQSLESIIGRKRVSVEDRDGTIWIGIYGNQEDFWIGFGLRDEDEDMQLQMQVEKSVTGNRMEHVSKELQPDFAGGKTWLKKVRKLDAKMDGNSELIKEWLLSSARQLLSQT